MLIISIVQEISNIYFKKLQKKACRINRQAFFYLFGIKVSLNTSLWSLLKFFVLNSYFAYLTI